MLLFNSQLHSNKNQDLAVWAGLDFEVDPVVVLQVWIIHEPVPPFPERGCHFVQEFALRLVAEHMLSQPLSPGGFLLPEFLFVAGLFTPGDSKSALAPCFCKGFEECKRCVPCVWSKGRSATSWTCQSRILRSSSCPSSGWSTSAFCLMAEEQVLTAWNHSEKQRRHKAQERSTHSSYKTDEQRQIFCHHRFLSDGWNVFYQTKKLEPKMLRHLPSVDIVIRAFIAYKCDVVKWSLCQNTVYTQVNRHRYVSHREQQFTVAGCCTAAPDKLWPAEKRGRQTRRCPVAE